MPPPVYEPFTRANDCKCIRTSAPVNLLIFPTASLNPFDANVIAVSDRPVKGQDGYWVISSPNAEWIPEVKWGARSVFRRADGRFGYEDRTLWPQYYADRFETMCCIPREPEDPEDPLSILWWNPGSVDFIPISGSSIDMGLGELAPGPLAKLKVWRDKLVDEVYAYQTVHHRNSLLGILETSMRHAWLRLTLAPMTRRDMTENVPDFQRYCLDIRGLLDYILIYSSRMEYPDLQTDGLPVAHHLMGALTESDEIVLQFVKMKIPVWHIRPSTKISPHMNIRRVVFFSTPREMNLLRYPDDPFPIICREWPGTRRLQATQRLGCVGVDLGSNISSVEPEPAPPPSNNEPVRGGGPPKRAVTKPTRPAPCMYFLTLCLAYPLTYSRSSQSAIADIPEIAVKITRSLHRCRCTLHAPCLAVLVRCTRKCWCWSTAGKTSW